MVSPLPDATHQQPERLQQVSLHPGRPHRMGFPTARHVGTCGRRGIINFGFQIFTSLSPPCNIKKKSKFFLKGKNKYIPAEGLRKTTLLYSLIL